VDFFIVNEVTRNVDGYRLSTYLYKDRDSHGGLLSMGPVWDFDLSMGNSDYCQAQCTSGWAHEFNTYCRRDPWLIPIWWERLLGDTLFTKNLKCRWKNLRQSTLATSYPRTSIDSISAQLQESAQRDLARWESKPHGHGSYKDEIEFLKNWLAERLEWLNEHMPGICPDN